MKNDNYEVSSEESESSEEEVEDWPEVRAAQKSSRSSLQLRFESDHSTQQQQQYKQGGISSRTKEKLRIDLPKTPTSTQR